MTKRCEVCKKEIPNDFGNNLCMDCYNKQVKEIEARKAQEAEERKERGKEPHNAPKPIETPIKSTTGYNKQGITDPNYKENPVAEDKDQWMSNVIQFQKSGRLLWNETKAMYTFLKNYLIRKALEHPQYPKFIWKPKIVDVGCGCGVGSNIMSMEADFVWGIDKNAMSINFAKEAFTREKNGIYYSSQVSFDQVDIIKDTREFMKFDFVVAIEVIEHIFEYKKFLENIIKFAKKDKKGSYDIEGGTTEFFISTPNRNHPKISVKGPKNKFHVREWTAQEYHAVLSEYFENIEFFTCTGKPLPFDTKDTPILAKTSLPKI